MLYFCGMKTTIRDVNKVLWKHIRPHKGPVILLLALVGLGTSVQLIVPWLYKLFFDTILGDMTPFYGDIPQTLVAITVLVFVTNFFGNLFWRGSGVINAHIQPLIMRNLERDSYNYLQDHSYRFFSNSFTGGLIRKIRRLSKSFHLLFDHMVWHFFSLAMTFIVAVIVIGFRSPPLSIAIIGFTIIFIIQNIIFSKWKLGYDEKRATIDSEVTATLADGVTNNLNIKLFGGFDFEKNRFNDVSGRFKKLMTFTWNLNEINMTIQGLLFAILEFGVIYYAIQFWQQGLLTVGDFALLQSYILITFRKMWDIGRYIRDTYEAYADAKEMVEILNTPHEIRDTKTAKALEVTRGRIEFKDVIFRYAKTRTILDKLNLKIKAKEKVALVGPSGAGKSTIVKILFRFFDIQRGQVLVDGQRITKVTQESLRNQIALVPQEAVLFHRSIIENIRYGRRDATDEEVVEAAKKARCHDFILELSEGYETLVGERGIKLSGGERQRVAIARAILKNAPILVLDEATSSLDSESEALIQEALDELMKNKTTIVIAHRLSTIMKMDRIVVIEQGKVVDMGTHAQLKKKTGTYKKLWEIQAGGFTK